MIRRTQEYRIPFSTTIDVTERFDVRKRLIEVARHIELIALYESMLPDRFVIERLPRTDTLPPGWKLKMENE